MICPWALDWLRLHNGPLVIEDQEVAAFCEFLDDLGEQAEEGGEVTDGEPDGGFSDEEGSGGQD